MIMKKVYKSLKKASVFLVFLTSSFAVFAQDRNVSGTVKDEGGNSMPGVNVIIKGTTSGTATDGDGKYTLTVSTDAILVFTFVGYTTREVPVGTQTVVDVQMMPDAQSLSEIVVTGYFSEKKADIIGSVAVVNSKDLMLTPSANLTQQLQGRAPGVIVSGSGAPGEAAKIRIRGIGSFSGQSDPLFIIDGVPTGDASRVNPNEVESIQVLKDATSASIYGARAANGVVIITTKQGKAGTASVSYDGYYGTSYIPKSYHPDVLNTQEYVQYLEKSHDPNAPQKYVHPLFGTAGTLSIPDYYVISTIAGNIFRGGFAATAPQVNPSLYSIPANDYSQIYQIAKVSPGTNWFDEVTRAAAIQNHQITATGGTEKALYSLGLNYLNQDGIYQYSGFKRYSLRLNSSFKLNKFFRLGENFQLIRDESMNTTGGGARGEASAWAQSFRMVPYLPVHDIGGGWGGNGIGDSGNGTNPVAQLWRDKDDVRLNTKVTGNVFAEATPVDNLVLRTSFGLEYGNSYSKDIVRRTYERAENTGTAQLNVFSGDWTAWTWSNTLTYNKTFGQHTVKVLAGTEAVKSGIQNYINASQFAGFDFEDPIFMSLQTANSKGTVIQNRDPATALFSYFGRLDYTFKDKYLFNATFRSDKSSKFGSNNRTATFPAFGLGYRISSEGFMQGIDLVEDLKVRGGWGQMGNQGPANALDQYATFRSNAGYTNYDINRAQGSLAQGYTAFNASTQNTRWEKKESVNVGFDATLKYGISITLDWFKNTTKDLLVRPQPVPVGGIVQYPFVNKGDIENKGLEMLISKRGNISPGLTYDAGLTFTHYKNKAIKLDENPLTFITGDASRLSNVWRTQAGQPVSSFYGYQLDGFFNTPADVAALDMPDAIVGSWRYKDMDNDGDIDVDDRTFIGNPQPDFVMGISLGLRYQGFDLSSFFVWNYGGTLFNYTKYWTEMRVFVGGVSKRVLYEGWTPESKTGELPYLGTIDGPNASTGYTDFIRSTVSDYYLESASYFRARTVQIGYSIPTDVAARVKMTRARVYVQGQNLFTISKYSGPDPDINIQGGDLFMGLDDAAFPNPRQFLIGLNLTF
jgi:TonB-dependent starch-binding outer membrane protein SusC